MNNELIEILVPISIVVGVIVLIALFPLYAYRLHFRLEYDPLKGMAQLQKLLIEFFDPRETL